MGLLQPMRGLLPWLLVGFLSYAILRGAQTVATLTTAQVKVNLLQLRIDGTLLQFLAGTAPLLFPLSIQNTTEGALRFGGFTGGLFLGDALVGTIDYTTPAILAPMGGLNLSVPVHVPLGEALTAIADALGSGAPVLRIDGTLRIDGIPIPLDQNIPLAIPAAA